MKDIIEQLDILEELEPYQDRFDNASIKGDELVSSSPFREDRSPSFSLNLDSGLWIDFGSHDDIWGSGNFYQLMAYFTGEHPEDVLDRYRLYLKGVLKDLDTLTLSVDLPLPEEYVTYSLKDFNYWKYKTNYLTNRGITEKAQRSFKVGYDHANKAIAIPIIDKEGQVVNIKFRKTKHKQFYYLPDGQRVSQHLYGDHLIRRLKCEKAFVVESEIDCMYLWSYGIPAVALSTAHLSKRQEELLDLGPLKELVLAFDNDYAGEKAFENTRERLSGKFRLYKLNLPKNAKDVNDLPVDVLRNKDFNVKRVPISFLN